MRARIRDAIRSYFAEQGFIEVECGVLQVSPGNEAHLHGFATERVAPDGARTKLYLHTSPEFACKKLLAAGEDKIFSFGPVFRNRESGALHASEFTMLEWYRARESYDAVMSDCIELLRLAARLAEREIFRFRGREARAAALPQRVSVHDAFRRHADMDLAATLLPDGSGNREAMAEAATRAGIKIAADDSWSDIFSRILVERIEPMLGAPGATLLDRYPRAEAALARACGDDTRFAERFELYVCGVELANGFGELTDPAEQRARFDSEMAEKERVYGERYPVDEDFLAALPHMPEASGVALGFDRLVMLATGAERIDQVIWTPARQSGM